MKHALLAIATAAVVAACSASAPVTSPVTRSPAADPTHSFPTPQDQPSSSPWDIYPIGWTQLPPPPVTDLQGATSLLVGDRYLVWGTPATTGRPAHGPRGTGYLFDPAIGHWTTTSPAPGWRFQSQAVWTGQWAIFWGGLLRGPYLNSGLAYAPSTDTWRRIPAAPIPPRSGPHVLWTGSEALVWGGYIRGEGGQADGAAFDPRTWTWRKIAAAPLPLSGATALWTGDQMFVFGADLNARNHASTYTAVAETYDPATDAWLRLPDSPLSAQASSGAMVAGAPITYDYSLRAALYSPANGWSVTTPLPIPGGECYPDAAAVGPYLFAWYCGVAALYDPATTAWQLVKGGLTKATITTSSGSTYREFRFADIASTGHGVILNAEGITLRGRSVCYGCGGSREQLWFYRPPARLTPTPALLTPREQAVQVVQDFSGARAFRAKALMRPVLAGNARLDGALYPNDLRSSTRQLDLRSATGGRFVAVVRFTTTTGGYEDDRIVIGPGTAMDGHTGLVVLTVQHLRSR